MEVAEVKDLKQQKIRSLKKRVRLIREKSGMGQTTFGKTIKVSGETIKKAEGQGQLGIDTAICLAKRYGVSLDYLYGLSDVENHDFEHIGRAFEVVFSAEEEEYIQDAITEKTIFNAFRLECSENLLKYLAERKKMEKNLCCAADEEARKNIQENIEVIDNKYEKRISDNGEKTTYIVMNEEFFEHLLKVVNDEEYPEIERYKAMYADAVNKSNEGINKLNIDT